MRPYKHRICVGNRQRLHILGPLMSNMQWVLQTILTLDILTVSMITFEFNKFHAVCNILIPIETRRIYASLCRKKYDMHTLLKSAKYVAVAYLHKTDMPKERDSFMETGFS